MSVRIARDIHLNKLIRSKHNGMIKVITGVRRCGKSYLLFKLFCEHLKSCGVFEDHIIKINLEDRRNKSLRNPDALLAYIDSKMKDGAMYYILLDEIQLVEEFEDVLNSYLTVPNADVYVTGSNSKFLSTDVITEFRGRGYEIHIAPLCFREFYSVFNGTREQAFAEYSTYGGLPIVALSETHEEKSNYLKSLFETTYITDIKERYRIKNDAELGELIDILSSSIGCLTNAKKLADTFKTVKNVNISHNTIKNYLQILQEAFLVTKANRYDVKGKNYIATPSKFYFTDLGLRNARINFRQVEVTHLMENIIYNELLLCGMDVDVGVVTINEKNISGAYQRKQLEVDFVCNRGSKRYYIQSAYRLASEEKLTQELKSLRNIDDYFTKIVITDEPILPHHNEEGIMFMNIYDFLLNPDRFIQ